ncbi:MAG: helix-turn-helix domain-containing protein [Bacteroidales bacterium]|nr:helix-turn-helix domain-containing protein [Bacteroidales bacterium]
MRYIKNLNFETLNLLNRIYKSSKKYQTRQRAHCIILSFKGFTISQLIEIFNVHLNTIYNYLDNWVQYGLLSLYNQKGQGRKSLIKTENEQFIKHVVKKYPNQLKKVLAILDKEKEIKMSLDTLKRFIKKNLN